MKNHMVPFWNWNKRESKMSFTPKRVASGKASFSQRVLQSLCGVPLYRNWEKHIRALKREKRNAAIYAEKFGRRA